MGTERDTVYKGPCICGKGLFVVDYCNPDHGWPTSTPFWYETSITCQDCNKLYDLIDQGNAITIVEKKELARQNKLKEQWYRLREDIMRLPEVKEIVRDFVTLLKQQRTMAATHRLLKEANLDYYSLGTFRKKWLGPEQWVERNLSPNNLQTVMNLLSIKNDQILEEVARLDELWAAANAPLQSIGNVYVKS